MFEKIIIKKNEEKRKRQYPRISIRKQDVFHSHSIRSTRKNSLRHGSLKKTTMTGHSCSYSRCIKRAYLSISFSSIIKYETYLCFFSIQPIATWVIRFFFFKWRSKKKKSTIERGKKDPRPRSNVVLITIANVRHSFHYSSTLLSLSSLFVWFLFLSSLFHPL